MDIIKIETTTDSKEEAQKLASHLLNKKLAACVQISGPIESHYWWKKKIEVETEWTLSIKTTSSNYSAVEKALVSKHPYDVPEILAYPVLSGSEDYTDWIKKSVN